MRLYKMVLIWLNLWEFFTRHPFYVFAAFFSLGALGNLRACGFSALGSGDAGLLVSSWGLTHNSEIYFHDLIWSFSTTPGWHRYIYSKPFTGLPAWAMTRHKGKSWDLPPQSQKLTALGYKVESFCSSRRGKSFLYYLLGMIPLCDEKFESLGTQDRIF